VAQIEAPHRQRHRAITKTTSVMSVFFHYHFGFFLIVCMCAGRAMKMHAITPNLENRKKKQKKKLDEFPIHEFGIRSRKNAKTYYAAQKATLMGGSVFLSSSL
jgi:hypothetical protein